MWSDTPFTELVGIRYPLIQAPMAGSTTPAMVAAVSNAGGLGSLAAARLRPAEVTAACRAIRAATARPFNVNFFVYTPPVDDPVREAAFRARLAP